MPISSALSPGIRIMYFGRSPKKEIGASYPAISNGEMVNESTSMDDEYGFRYFDVLGIETELDGEIRPFGFDESGYVGYPSVESFAGGDTYAPGGGGGGMSPTTPGGSGFYEASPITPGGFSSPGAGATSPAGGTLGIYGGAVSVVIPTMGGGAIGDFYTDYEIVSPAGSGGGGGSTDTPSFPPVRSLMRSIYDRFADGLPVRKVVRIVYNGLPPTTNRGFLDINSPFLSRYQQRYYSGFSDDDSSPTVAKIGGTSLNFSFGGDADDGIACECSSNFNKNSHYIDLEFDEEVCKDPENEIYFDIYGSVTVPEICEPAEPEPCEDDL